MKEKKKEYRFKFAENAMHGYHKGLTPWKGYFKEGTFNGNNVEALVKDVNEIGMDFTKLIKVFEKYDKDNGTRWSRPLQIEIEKMNHDMGLFKRSILRMIESMIKEKGETG